MIAPGYQATLFEQPESNAGVRWRVVDAAGRRYPTTSILALAVGHARALALAEGRAWIVADDNSAAEITASQGAFSVSPRGPGWPALVSQMLTDHGTDAQECA